MGQTLTHGVYLPAEGERNCYDGLASNWNILDGAVGTIAEHTTALAGKAPAVHTHTKSDITDFPAFGNAAGTICEGNDSRLSDARTPTAHTHTKSDVTDLLNSNFIPSANNSYDLGSSSYQWNNLYAKNYYYNGTPWGLDKANTWTGNNIFPLKLAQKGFSPRASVPASNEFGAFDILDTGNSAIMSINYSNRVTGARDISFRVYDNSGNVSGASVFKDENNNYSFCPITPNKIISLGNSTNKWKSLNGVNPGALSLPNLDSDGYVDLSSNLTENVQYTYTPAVDGWLALYAQVNGFHAENAVGIFNGDTTLGNNSFRWANVATSGINLQRQASKYYGSVFLPVRAGYPYLCWLRVNSSTTLGQKQLMFYKAKGNV